MLIDEIRKNPKDKVLEFSNSRKIIKKLTTRKRFIGPWDFYFIEGIFKAAGMVGAGSVEVKDVVKKMRDLGAFLSANLNGGGTGWQILSNITPEEVEAHVRAITMNKLEAFSAMVKAHHVPKEFLEEIQLEYRTLDIDGTSHQLVESNKKRKEKEKKDGKITGNEPMHEILRASIAA
ncbi:MAG: hypothetical protein ACYS1A_17105 [Planctomycetota bacterium]